MELREIRDILEMSVGDAAIEMGVSTQTVRNIEGGKKPSRLVREKIENLERKAKRKNKLES